jgi:hypothetical protein
MAITETCSCGASFSAERNDELKLVNAWRSQHKCSFPKAGDLAIMDMARSELAPDFTEPELHIGFRRLEEDDDD